MTLWNLQVPHCVRSFLWRLAHQCLPTRTNLITRGIHCDDSCVTCDAQRPQRAGISSALVIWSASCCRRQTISQLCCLNFSADYHLHNNNQLICFFEAFGKAVILNYGMPWTYRRPSQFLVQEIPFKSGVACRGPKNKFIICHVYLPGLSHR